MWKLTCICATLVGTVLTVEDVCRTPPYFELYEKGGNCPRVMVLPAVLDFGSALLSRPLIRRFLVASPTADSLHFVVRTRRNGTELDTCTESGCEEGADISSRDVSGWHTPPKAFYLASPVSLQPLGLQLELAFSPSSAGQHKAEVCVQTKTTEWECAELRGTGQVSCQFEGELRVDLSLKDFGEQLVAVGNSQMLPPVFTLTKLLQTRNVGLSAVSIVGMLLNGESCSLWGVVVEDCTEGLYVQPGEYLSVVLTYSYSWSDTAVNLTLVLQTDLGMSHLPVYFTLASDVELPVLVDLVGMTAVLLPYAEVCQLLLVAMCVGHFAVLLAEVLTTTHTFSVRRKRLRVNPVRLSRVFSPVFASEQVREVQAASETQGRSAGRKRKVRKQKNCVLKFAPTVQQSSVEARSEVIATNKLLARVVKRHKPPDDVESLATAYTEEDTDIFLDDYKARHSLFSGFTSVME